MINKIQSQEDLIEILKTGKEFHSQSRFGKHTLDLRRIVQYLEKAEKVPEGMFFVYEKDSTGKVIAYFLGAMTVHPLMQIKVAVDLSFFVHPEHRGTKLFYTMLKAFENWAEKNGATYTQLSHTSGIETEKSSQLFEKLGYQNIGAIFMKEYDYVH